jgi:hypothetical protein
MKSKIILLAFLLTIPASVFATEPVRKAGATAQRPSFPAGATAKASPKANLLPSTLDAPGRGRDSSVLGNIESLVLQGGKDRNSSVRGKIPSLIPPGIKVAPGGKVKPAPRKK